LVADPTMAQTNGIAGLRKISVGLIASSAKGVRIPARPDSTRTGSMSS
jgi:hypothetical protein